MFNVLKGKNKTTIMNGNNCYQILFNILVIRCLMILKRNMSLLLLNQWWDALLVYLLKLRFLVEWEVFIHYINVII